MNPPHLGALPTEASNPLTSDFSALPTAEALLLMNDEDARVAPAVRQVVMEIALAVDAIAARLGEGGRLFYIGAGTSGRLGVVDASECPPTFGVPAELVQGLIAGGRAAVFQSQEGAEDIAEDGASVLKSVTLTARDAVVGLAASGRTPYVMGALAYAREIGAFTAGITVNPEAPMAALCDVFIAPSVGPEVITGSTRLKAGTAQKLVLNMISTGVMTSLGYVDGNRMTHLRPSCGKLVDRARRLVMETSGVDEAVAQDALDRHHGEAWAAIEDLKNGSAASASSSKA